jgi:Zn finger protein HypA/HybF involved in hydrogenase expression
MGKFFQENETVRVEFPDGEYVEIKEELSQDDQDYITSHMASIEDDDKKNGSKNDVPKKDKVTLRIGRLTLLERSIVNWSFKDAKGESVPINRDNVSRLRVKYRVKVLESIDKQNALAGAFAAKN